MIFKGIRGKLWPHTFMLLLLLLWSTYCLNPLLTAAIQIRPVFISPRLMYLLEPSSKIGTHCFQKIEIKNKILA
jgi:hypothetical protein